MELVFVSSDRDEEAFKEYYGEMPWLALPFADRAAKNALSKMMEVDGIPSLVVLGPKEDGKREVINGSARGEASIDNIAAFPWYPKPYGDLSKSVECGGSDINETASVIVFCEGADDDEQADIVACVKEVAEKKELKGADGSDFLFFYGTKSGGYVDRVRQLCGLDGDDKKGEVCMVLLDIPDNGGYYVSKGGDITADSIKEFVNERKKSDRVQLG